MHQNTEMEYNENAMLDRLSVMAETSFQIDTALYTQYDVKRGLRDISGKGVLAGLTQIGEIFSYTINGDKLIPAPGQLIYRGIDISEIVNGFMREGRCGFEETCYLLLFGELPNRYELKQYEEILADYRILPDGYLHDAILKSPSRDIMNALARSVLALYIYDDNADATDIKNVLRQCLQLIAAFPLLVVYSYQANAYQYGGKSLVIHGPLADLSLAENFLHMLRHDSRYSSLEVKLLDLALVLHAEHGGGNNSSFMTHVITSSGTDTYSAIAAALGSLKGPKHGGANIKVVQMFEDMKQQVSDWNDDNQVENYLLRILDRNAFDRSGLIYGIGHAVYSISDPRTLILKEQVKDLAREKGFEDEYRLYAKVEKLAPEVIGRVRKMYKGVSANVDFYSGLLYRMLEIPPELYTPLFAMARIVGWSAHRIEEIANAGKIIRPAYKAIAPRRDYVPLESRKGINHKL
ncbi:citrate/2-methylcitrate synthase [Candidatus Latescibacterota bacterium]